MMPNPLRDAAPAEIPLARPPLHRVLAAAHFPAILKISEQSGIISFQEKLRKVYPIFQREQEVGMQIQMAPTGEMLPPQHVITNVWRFLAADESWRVTLSTEVIALETHTAYANRTDFLSGLRQVLEIFTEEFEPAVCKRIGIRYLNVLDATDLNAIKRAVRQGLRSLSDTELAEHITGSGHSVVFEVPEGTLQTRWGILPPQRVHDPNVLQPSDTRRWYLDLDCFSEAGLPFGGDALVSRARLMTERIYAFFLWAMTPEFIEARKNA